MYKKFNYFFLQEFIDIMFKNKPQPDLTKLSMYDLMQENIQNY